MFCPKCGKQIQDGVAFCPYCRYELKASASPTSTQVMLLTSNYAPGYKVDKVLGMVYGITVRSRGLGGNIIAGFRTLAGGEIKEYTEMAHQARQQALDRLSEHASSLGANAVMSVMFDSTEIGNTMDEIIAFGTAVLVSPLSETQQFVKLS
ncbi:MAG TPA: heavy metal-binding domain-containing protein [Nitrososphaerales archaeon]|nr:heavy metal-binding domain-containing protein [Nitrososphaerales archaeon]